MIVVSNSREKYISQKVVDLFSVFALEQVNLEATRTTSLGKSNILDLLATSEPHLVDSIVVEEGISDHKIITAVLKIDAYRLLKPPRKIYLFQKANIPALKEFVKGEKEALIRFFQLNSVDDSWSEFLRILHEGTSRFVPTKMVRDRKDPRWVKPKLRSLHRKQREFHSLMKSFPRDSREYEEYRRKYLHFKSAAKIEARNEFDLYRRETLHESLENNPKEFWSYVRETRGKQSTVTHLIDSKGCTITESREKANILNEHFRKSFITDNGRVSAFPPRVSKEMGSLEISETGVRNLLLQIDSKKAPGHHLRG